MHLNRLYCRLLMHLARLQASASNLHLQFSGLVSAFALSLPSDVAWLSWETYIQTYKIYHYLHSTVTVASYTKWCSRALLCSTVQEEEGGGGKEGGQKHHHGRKEKDGNCPNTQESGWQKLRGGTGGPLRKVWTQTKILSPNIRYFVAN